VEDAAPELPRPGDVVDRYRVIAPVATGGMAAVFAAQRSSLGGFDKLLALKVILPQLANERYFLDMFLDEARIASQIQHPNVVAVYDVVEHHGLPCIVMEYLHGRSFATVLEVGAPVAVCVAVLAAAAEGLAAAHRALGRDGLPLGVIHRDVSPQNVHVGYDGQVRLVDFGIAAARGRLSSTRAGTVKGKLEYLAPEQITGSHRPSAQTDVWSFGVMAWQALAGRSLFADEHDAATMWNVVNREVPALPELPGLDRAVIDVVMGCLDREPDRRIALERCVAVLGALARDVLTDPRAAVAAHMAACFAQRKRADERTLERTLSRVEVQAPARRDAGRSRRGLALGWIGAAAIGGAAVVLAWVLALAPARGSESASAPPSSPTIDVAAPTSSPTAPIEAPPISVSAPIPISDVPTSPPTATIPEPAPTPRRARARGDQTPRAAPTPKRLFESPY
jgi:eukaryotic-like serine/threonine-protein kinase